MNHHPERFDKRVIWCCRNLEPDETVISDPPFGVPLQNAVCDPGSLRHAVARLLGLKPDAAYKKIWQRAMNSDSPSVPDAIIVAISRIYPEVPAELLRAPAFLDFEQGMAAIQAALKKWIRATRFVTNNRQLLAETAKRYYTAVDDLQAFPLIGKRSWLLDRPQELTEHDVPPERDTSSADPPVPVLDVLNVGYKTVVMQALGKKRLRWNGPSYRVTSIAVKDGCMAFSFGRTWYFDYVDGLEVLGAELADFIITNPKAQHMPQLPLRGSPSSIFEFRNRPAFAGVNCILILKHYYRGSLSSHPTSYAHQFVLHDRPDSALEARNTFHVVPARGHQPAVAFGIDHEWKIWRTVAREFCEELFDRGEANKLVKSAGGDYIEIPEYKEVVDAVFRKPAAKVFLMGVGCDPVTTKPEILVAIVMDWSKFRTNKTLKIETNYEGKAEFVDLNVKNLEESAAIKGKKPMLPAGQACLLLAAKHYDFLMNAI